jgi:hypothetical protein
VCVFATFSRRVDFSVRSLYLVSGKWISQSHDCQSHLLPPWNFSFFVRDVCARPTLVPGGTYSVGLGLFTLRYIWFLQDVSGLTWFVSFGLRYVRLGYHSFQNLLPSGLLPDNAKLKFILYGRETCFSIPREERKLRVSENRCWG